MDTCMNAAMFRLCLTQICTLNIDRSKYCYIQPPVKFIKPIELQMNQYNLIHDLRVIICQKYVGFSLDLMPQTETPSWLVIPNQCRIVTMCITNKLHSKQFSVAPLQPCMPDQLASEGRIATISDELHCRLYTLHPDVRLYTLHSTTTESHAGKFWSTVFIKVENLQNSVYRQVHACALLQELNCCFSEVLILVTMVA